MLAVPGAVAGRRLDLVRGVLTTPSDRPAPRLCLRRWGGTGTADGFSRSARRAH